MNLTYNQKQTYQILCDNSGLVGCCYQITNIDIFGDGVYMVSTTTQQQITLDDMKKIVVKLKGE